MTVKTVIFDLGNVVLKFDIRIIARKIAGKFSLNEDKLFNLFFDSPLTQIHDEGKIDAEEFHKQAMKKLGVEMGFGEFKEIWNDIFIENEDVIKLVLLLSKKYKVFLMSNTNKMHFDYIKNKFDIIKKFDRIFTSFEVGEMKPHPKIYTEAIESANAEPGEIVFIDDRKELVEGAKELGIRAIQFENIDQLKGDLKKNGVKVE